MKLVDMPPRLVGMVLRDLLDEGLVVKGLELLDFVGGFGEVGGEEGERDALAAQKAAEEQARVGVTMGRLNQTATRVIADARTTRLALLGGLAGAALFAHSLVNARVIDPGFPTVAVTPKHALRSKMISNIEQVLARDGEVTGLVVRATVKDL